MLKILGIIIGIIILLIIIGIVIYKIVEVNEEKKILQARIKYIQDTKMKLAQFLYKHGDVNKIDTALEIVEDYTGKYGKGIFFKKVVSPDNPTPDEKKQYEAYLESKRLLSSLSDESINFYEEYRSAVKEQFDVLVQSAIAEQARNKQIALDKIQDDRAKATVKEEQEEKTEKVSRAIKELEKLIAILQDSVDKTRNLDRADLRTMLTYLDTIEDNKAFIAPNDRNNLKRAQNFTLALFKRAENLKDIKENVKPIKDCFKKISKKR